MRKLVLYAMILFFIFPAGADAAVVRVPGDQPTIQAGINAAATGDTVLVADGTYTGPGNRDLDFNGKSITVTSENGPEACIINCQDQGRGFHFHSWEDASAVLDGFSIGNGVSDGPPGGGGGGILIEGGAFPVVSNCMINGCNAGYGGGVSASSGLLRDCVIRNNQANTGAGLALSGSAVAHNCLVFGNHATEMGGGLYGGDGLATVSNCTFTVNSCLEDGGGLFIYNLSMTNCIIWNNSAGFSGDDGFVSMYGNIFSYSYSEMGIYWYVEGSWVLDPGPGNFVADPLFTDGPDGSYYLCQTAAGQTEDSPCLDNGDPAAALFGSTRTDHVPDNIVLDMGSHHAADPGPKICHDPAYFTYTDLHSGGPPPPDRTLEIWNGAGETLNWSVSSTVGWLALSPTSGSSSGETDLVTIHVDPSGLGAGTERAEIVISAPGAWNSPVAIPVTLVLDGPFPYWGFVAGPGPSPNNPPLVRVFDGWGSPVLRHEFPAYGAAGYGVRVACGDPDGDGTNEIVTGAGPGAIYGPHVRGFEPDGSPLPGLSFMAYGTLKYGVNVTCGDLDGDGTDEIVTGAGPGAVFGPHVRAFRYHQSAVTPLPGVSFFAYGTLRWGVNIDCGDLDGDGLDEIVTGGGPGASFGPHVRGWNVDGGVAAPMPGISFMAYNSEHYGVNVACGDLDGDGLDEIVTAPGPGPELSSWVRGWNADGSQATLVPGCSVSPWPVIRRPCGARVAVVPGDQPAETILVGGGPAPAALSDIHAYLYDTDSEQLEFQFSFYAFDGMALGVDVAGGLLE